MSRSLHVDFGDTVRVIDFLVEFAPYAPEKERKEAEQWVQRYQNREAISTSEIASVAMSVARLTWAPRWALEHYLTHEGVEEEWKMILGAIRASTAHLLERFRRMTDTDSLDEVLQHAESDQVLRDEERFEIEETRRHVREVLWKQKAEHLVALIRIGDSERKGYQKRLAALRELALGLPSALQEELLSKIEHYEDRIFFAGEVVSQEILDQEIAYYREQREDEREHRNTLSSSL